jgi:predicted ATPase
MSARQEIAGLLEQWLELTQAEAAAIRSETWPSLKEIQAAKTSLQKRLSEAREKWASESPGEAFACACKHPFFAEIARLLSLETRNAELLAARLRRACAKRESMNEAARNLRNVRQSYVVKPAGVWNRSR